MQKKLLNHLKKFSTFSCLPKSVGRKFIDVETPEFTRNLVFSKEPNNILVYSWKVHPKSIEHVVTVSKILAKKNKNVVLPKELFEILMNSKYCLKEEAKNIFSFDPSNINECKDLENLLDFCICFGGDGTMLRLNSLFQNIPPVIGYRPKQSLGFLLSHDLDFSEKGVEYTKTIENVVNSKSFVLERMKMNVEVVRDKKILEVRSTLNDVFINRKSDIPIVFEVYLDGYKFNTIKGDGVIVSTSTGSTGYNLSCNGSAAHPSLNCFIVTPINHSIPFGFSPFIVGDKNKVKIKMSEKSRSNATIAFDALQGKSRALIVKDEVLITKSKYPCYTVVNDSVTKSWMKKVTEKSELKFDD